MTKLYKNKEQLLYAFNKAIKSKPDYTIWTNDELVREINKDSGHLRIVARQVQYILNIQNNYRVFKNVQSGANYIFIPKQKPKREK